MARRPCVAKSPLPTRACSRFSSPTHTADVLERTIWMSSRLTTRRTSVSVVTGQSRLACQPRRGHLSRRQASQPAREQPTYRAGPALRCTAYTIREPFASSTPIFVGKLDTITPPSDPDTED